MSNEINRLMHLLADELTPKDIDEIIVLNRKWLAAYERGEKITQDLPKIDLEKIGMAKPVEIKRRKGL